MCAQGCLQRVFLLVLVVVGDCHRRRRRRRIVHVVHVVVVVLVGLGALARGHLLEAVDNATPTPVAVEVKVVQIEMHNIIGLLLLLLLLLLHFFGTEAEARLDRWLALAHANQRADHEHARFATAVDVAHDTAAAALAAATTKDASASGRVLVECDCLSFASDSRVDARHVVKNDT